MKSGLDRAVWATLAALFLGCAGVVPARAANRDLNVKTDCGAKGDGEADDTVPVQACIDKAARSGQAIYLPAGSYRISHELRIASDDSTIYGTTNAGTKIVQANGSANILSISKSGGPINRIQVRNLELLYSAPEPRGAAIYCENCWRTYFQQMRIGRAEAGLYMGTGIRVIGGNQVFVEDSVLTFARIQGLYFAAVGDVFLSNVEVNQRDDDTKSVGVVFDTGVGGIYATNVNVTAGHTGFLFQNSQKRVPPNFGFFTNCLADTLNGVGWDFQAAQSMRLTNSWSATAALYGIVVKDVDGLSITDSRIYNNGAEGILVRPGATNLTIKSSTIAGNSRLQPGRMAGISIAPGVSDFQILNNMIGAADGFGNSQSYGILIAAGASDNYMISGNALRKNLKGGMRDSATGSNKLVAGNL